ncbi:MAG TPA: serine/threonine-protein kinase, partial [bacterium]|nr:serine/threonine-protein kinase [bacterium]
MYLAEQLRPIRRHVALKLIKPGMDTKQVIARFEAERQALALMDHPCIAQVHEAGETETGRPYFAMEYVEGIPITTFCDREGLRIPQRLELFLQVCDAIQHAHQKGVIHRDIKPSNVLVAMRDGSPSPKLIDFGIVKATIAIVANTMLGSTMMTREGMIVGTLGYMSPEQASGSPTVDTRSDIYSFGALLYELLAGAPPFDAQRLRQAVLSDAVRVIREEDPPTLTARFSRSNEQERKQIAEQRSVDPRRLARELEGELQWMTFRAMEKDPNRRYPSAAELAADIRRHLANEPVLAGAPSTMYRLRKYVRRHRVGVTAAAIALAGIVAGGIAAGIALNRAVRAEQLAKREAESSRQVSDFLVELFQSSTPNRSGGETITARTLLEEGRRRIETDATGDLQIRARLLRTIGDAHMGLGLYDDGLRLLTGALATSEAAEPRDELEIASQLRAVASGLSMAGKPESSAVLLERAMALFQEHGAPPSAMAE